MDIPGTPITAAAAAGPTTEAAAAGPAHQPNPTPLPARKKAAKKDASPKAAEGKEEKVGALGKSYVITLHDSKEVPPGGQLVAVNGIQFRIPTGRKCVVPEAVIEVLENAIQSTPDLDDDMRVVAYHDAPRLGFTLHRESVTAVGE